jgi:hypothetical protein
MPRYAHAIIVVTEGEDYLTSMIIASDIADGLGIEGENASLASYEHDNEGQRVVYLPPEDEEEPACYCAPTEFCMECGTAEDFKLHESDRG